MPYRDDEKENDAKYDPDWDVKFQELSEPSVDFMIHFDDVLKSICTRVIGADRVFIGFGGCSQKNETIETAPYDT